MDGSISPPLLETVARRAPVVKHLLENPSDKRELEGSLDVSRTTIDRALNSLDEFDCVVKRDGKWEVTLLGRLALEEYDRITGQYQALSNARKLLRELPPDAPIDGCTIADGEVLLSEQSAPHSPIIRLEELLEDCSQIRGLSPVVLPVYVRLFSEQILTHETDTELVLGKSIVKHLSTAYPEELDAALGAENATIWKHNQTPPFGLVLVDEKAVWIAVSGKESPLKGAIINDADSAVCWAKNAFQRYRDRSTQAFLRGGRSQTAPS